MVLNKPLRDKLHKVSEGTGFHRPVFSRVGAALVRGDTGLWGPVFSRLLCIDFCIPEWMLGEGVS